MPLLNKDGRIVEDRWIAVSEAEALGRPGDLIVPQALWQAERPRLTARAARLGLRLTNEQSPAVLADDLGRFALIALEFPKFTDGRAYSQARLLRERYRFQGELRAVGQVLSDQLAFMLRCGFDAFEVTDERALQGWRRAVEAFSAWYQPAGDAATPIPAQRLQRRPLRTRRAASPPATAPAPDSCAGHWAY